MLIKNNKGQSIVEVVFSIAFLALFLTGSVVLLTNALGAKTKGADRKLAAALGTQVIEGLVDKQKNDSANFWNLTPVTKQPMAGYDGYTYSVSYATNITGSCSTAPEITCVDATIEVFWGSSDNLVTFSRFFSKNN
jgi:hypothetical protein